MARQRDHSKERFWRAMMRQWRRSGLSIRDFCADHGLSVPSFYAWRRCLAERDLVDAATSPPGTHQAKHQPAFVPLQVLQAPTSPDLELVLDQGRVVRVPAGFDPTTLRLLLAVLKEEPSC